MLQINNQPFFFALIHRDLEEGDDIYFSCSVEANPPAYKITWWHNVSSQSFENQQKRNETEKGRNAKMI